MIEISFTIVLSNMDVEDLAKTWGLEVRDISDDSIRDWVHTLIDDALGIIQEELDPQ